MDNPTVSGNSVQIYCKKGLANTVYNQKAKSWNSHGDVILQDLDIRVKAIGLVIK